MKTINQIILFTAIFITATLHAAQYTWVGAVSYPEWWCKNGERLAICKMSFTTNFVPITVNVRMEKPRTHNKEDWIPVGGANYIYKDAQYYQAVVTTNFTYLADCEVPKIDSDDIFYRCILTELDETPLQNAATPLQNARREKDGQ